MGNVTLTDILLDDPMLGGEIKLDKTTLVPGASTEVSKIYVVTQEDIDSIEIVNVAMVEGTPPNYDPEDPDSEKPTDEDGVKVPVAEKPAISLVKTTDKKEVGKVGEEIVYSFKITNIGNVTLSNLILTDKMLGGEIILDTKSLAPNESTMVTLKYKATKDDLKEKQISNTAEVSGTSPKGGLVVDRDNLDIKVKKDRPGTNLPKTSTNIFNLMLIGVALLSIGILLYRRRRTA